MSTEGAGSTRGGGESLHNEDAFLVEEGLGLFVVCDGASRTPAGERAARIASREVEATVAESTTSLEGPLVARSVVETAMERALAAVAAAEQHDADLQGLATTVTMLLVQGGQGVFGHRGDSRAYLIRRGRIRQLTVDDELTAGVARGRDRGPDAEVFSLPLQAGDLVVLCTDGAEAVVTDAGLLRAATTVGPRVLASRIVSAAHERNPDQDATAVVVRVRGDRDRSGLESSRPTLETAYGRTASWALRRGS
jgi:protein phosphatase